MSNGPTRAKSPTKIMGPYILAKQTRLIPNATSFFTHSRMELPAFMFDEFPRGFVTSLSDRDDAGRPKYMTVPVAWFKEGEKELLCVIKKSFPPFGMPSTTQKFRARMSLQKWMAMKLKQRYDDFFSKLGAEK